MIKIESVKVLGSGCAKCNSLEQEAVTALKELNVDIEIEHIKDFAQIATYGVMRTPALVVNEKVISFGKILKKDQIKELLVKAFETKPKVAFVCVHNSCRSQMAEALGKQFASDVFEAYSAGTETRPQINQDAVRIMKDLYKIDVEATQYSKLIDELPEIDIVVTMGCNVDCPYLPCKHREDWGLDDPTGHPDEEFINTAKLIETKVLELKNRIIHKEIPNL